MNHIVRRHQRDWVSILGSNPDIRQRLKTQMDKHLHTMVYGEFFSVQVQASALRETCLRRSMRSISSILG